ncbi:MAG: ribosomal-protein-alanine N-acetyltransferase [SAR202 cluster bacterium Io17-Chloro-G9]|nr:MAG: ribosomal-protein-alanine N-acetyltransferase [SAR202 cluster bacterium Io17-Chloro-G9]
MDASLRRLRAEDISQVVEIEREAFSPLWVSTPFKRELNNRYASYLVAFCGSEAGVSATPSTDNPTIDRSMWDRVASLTGAILGRKRVPPAPESSIAGYVSVWYQGEEAHITEIAVREPLRGNGIGELLLIGSLRAAMEYGSKVMTLEARVSNFIAQRLYEKYDFTTVGTRKAYYSDNREDAVIMTTSPILTEEYEKMFQERQEAYRSRWGEIRIHS